VNQLGLALANIAHYKGCHSDAFCSYTIVCVQKCIDNARGYHCNSLGATICDRGQNQFSALTIDFCQNFILTLLKLTLFIFTIFSCSFDHLSQAVLDSIIFSVKSCPKALQINFSFIVLNFCIFIGGWSH